MFGGRSELFAVRAIPSAGPQQLSSPIGLAAAMGVSGTWPPQPSLRLAEIGDI
jgi:hypothetical protein